MVSAVLAQQSRSAGLALADEIGAATVVLSGAIRHEACCALLGGGLSVLATAWHWDSSRLSSVLLALRNIVGDSALFASARLPSVSGLTDPSGATSFPHTVVLFGAALASGWPWATALQSLSSVRRGSFCNEGRGFMTSYGLQLPSERVLRGEWSMATISTREDCGPPVTVWFDATGVVFLSCSSSLRLRGPARPARGSSALVSRPGEQLRRQKPSRWFPEYIRMPMDEHGHVILPKNLVTSIVERRHVWAALIPNMDGVTRACVFGKLCYPRKSWRTTASWKPNHKPWEDEAAKRAIGPKAAQWFVTGALEYVPPDVPPPILVEPQSAVPKKGKDVFRNITDAREGNKCLDEWGVRYHSARDFGDGLSPCAIAFGDDVDEAYHINYLAGCTGELAWGWGIVGARLVYPNDPEYETLVDESSEDEGVAARPPRLPPEAAGDCGPLRRPVQKIEFGWRLHVGCDPRNCSRSCDKAHAGVDFDGTLARWAVPHFGQSPAGSALNAIALCLLRFMASRNPAPGERRGASVRTGNGVVWVDDFQFWTVVLAHALCGGLDGGCPMCLKFLPHAQRLCAEWKELCHRLGVPLSDTKHQAPSQRPSYAGFDFDTVRGLVLTQPSKLEKLLACLDSWLGAGEVTPRELDSIQGRILHYSYAIRYLRVVATQVYCVLGSVPESEYDTPVAVDDEMRSLAGEARLVVEQFQAVGRPLWPRVPSSLYREFLHRPVVGGLSFSLTWDASPQGWAAVLRWWDSTGGSPLLRDLLLIGSWPAEEEVAEQAHREALAAPLALEAACQAVDLRVRFGLLRNDAEAAIGALTKGSTSSPPMQRQAVRLNRVSYRQELDLLLAHVPGLALVEEGIDGASRAGAQFGPDANLEHVLGPRVGDGLWGTIESLVAPLGWKVTIDLFASECNSRAQRYCSRFPEPGAECVDALSVSDWGESLCPRCGNRHREVGYAFPPQPLIRPFVKKAIADSALCVVVVPVTITAPYWHKLVRASVLDSRPAVDGFLRIRNSHKLLERAGGRAPQELAVFACDFSRLNPRSDLPGLSRCAGAFARRQRPLCCSPGDLHDRRRLREALLSRPAGWGAPDWQGEGSCS